MAFSLVLRAACLLTMPDRVCVCVCVCVGVCVCGFFSYTLVLRAACLLILLPRGMRVGSFPSPSSWLTPGPLQKSGCFQGKVKLTEVFKFHFFGSVCFVVS